jgi:hypothetical protein
MKTEEFRDWLRARGCTVNSVNVRASEVKIVERAMPHLGSPFTDLDQAYDADQFAQLTSALDTLRSDARNGGDSFRAIFPTTSNPQGRITTARTLLGQYAQFRKGAVPNLGFELNSTDTYWFVGASFGRTEDQVERFLSEGIWEIRNPKDSEREAVKSMKAGDRIAIKAAFVQRHNLPFDNRGHNVSVMRIKARGVITSNDATGERISVDWEAGFEPREWFFYTFRPTIWEVHPGTEAADKLVAFAFYDEPQDIDWFRNHPSWAQLFGDGAEPTAQRFWIEKTIVANRPDRQTGDFALGQALWSPQKSKDGRNIYSTMLQVSPGDIVFHLTDNEAISSVSIASSSADTEFVGLEGSDWARQPAYLIKLVDHETLMPPLPREAFLETEPFATQLRELAESGAKGLFYNSRRGLNQGAYLTEATPTLLSILNRAYEAYAGQSLPHVNSDPSPEIEDISPSYTLEDAIRTLFLNPEVAAEIMLLWKAKKNIVLQGPPGVGKSYAAQKLAFALMGVEDRNRLGFVQFHQSYSYEDFVEGFRPTENGFELRAGKFVEFCRKAEADPNRPHVFIIDEINRGNLSKIFGELMLLIESDKRDTRWAMPLASGKVPFHVPANVYIMGLMNTADRSLAVVDYALRRRFAFVDLAPNLTSAKFRLQLEGVGVSADFVTHIVERLTLLNNEIAMDTANLGPGFMIGHSYFCAGPTDGESESEWYRRVIKTEIMPLLHEYWFDNSNRADSWKNQLLLST